jgi:CubicO group peptidase (beta-lactamase class C family)
MLSEDGNMKGKIALVGLLSFLAAFILAADNIPPRDYWPTKEWKVSEPELQGVDSTKLEELSAFIQDELGMTTSILVARHGYIVYEYYALDDSGKLREAYSVSKSVLSGLIGIAIKKGYIGDIDLPVTSLLPEYSTNELDEKAREISIRHLLTMSSGITSEEDDPEIKANLFSNKLRNDPGEGFFYNNVGPQLLSMILTKATGLSAHDFAKKELFSQIGISNTEWATHRIGDIAYSEGGFGLRITTRDLAKLGYLYLNNGIWDFQELVPSSWVRLSTSKQLDIPKNSWYFTREYGFFWWLRPAANHSSFTGIGWSGQFLYVIPDLDIVVVITALDEGNESAYFQIIDDYVVPSIMK